MYNIQNVSYIYGIVHYFPSTYLSYNCKFVPFKCHHLIFPSPAFDCDNHKSDPFFYEFVFEI